MTNQHPITPPPVDKFDQWEDNILNERENVDFVLECVWKDGFQTGADQQLAKDAEWLDQHALDAPHLKITPVGESLKEAMRPKPPSLKELALDELTSAERLYPADWSTIRRALEALPND